MISDNDDNNDNDNNNHEEPPSQVPSSVRPGSFSHIIHGFQNF